MQITSPIILITIIIIITTILERKIIIIIKISELITTTTEIIDNGEDTIIKEITITSKIIGIIDLTGEIIIMIITITIDGIIIQMGIKNLIMDINIKKKIKIIKEMMDIIMVMLTTEKEGEDWYKPKDMLIGEEDNKFI